MADALKAKIKAFKERPYQSDDSESNQELVKALVGFLEFVDERFGEPDSQSEAEQSSSGVVWRGRKQQADGSWKLMANDPVKK